MHDKHRSQAGPLQKQSFLLQDFQALRIGIEYIGAANEDRGSISRKQHIVVTALAVLLGSTNAFLLLGWAVINPASLDWLRGDSATHYLGWAFFRQDGNWYFPLTWTTQIGYPYGASIAFLDSIPLIAVLFRPFSGLLPWDFQYLGLYAIACNILLYYFGTKIFFVISGGRFWTSCAGGILIMLSPAFTWRLIDHFALASHWLLMGALYCYFIMREKGGIRKWLLYSTALLVIAGGVNPYIAVLTLLIYLAACLKLSAAMSVPKRRAIAAGLFGTLCTAASLTVFGFLFTGDGTEYSGRGYGHYSMNLVSPLDPQNFQSILLKQQPLALAGQYEGYNYLGLGVLLIFVAGLSRRWDVIKRLGQPDLFPLLLLAAVATLAAGSTVITLGPWIIADIDLPSVAESAASALRASGRLFWPAYYLLTIAAVWIVLAAFRPALHVPLLALAVLMQIADTASLRAQLHDVKLANSTRPILDFSGAPGRSRGGTAVLSDPEWARLSGAHRHLVLLPAWQCDRRRTPGGYNAFGRLAVSQHLTMNSYYAGRYSQKEKKIHCTDMPEQALSGNLDEKSVYVLSNEFAREIFFYDIDTHYCNLLEGFNVCRVRPGTFGLSPDLYERLYRVFPMEKRVSMSKSEPGYRFFGSGWSYPEQWGTWMAGEKAVIVMRRKAVGKQDLLLTATVNAFVNSRHPYQEIEVLANDSVVARWKFHAGTAGGSTSNPRVERIVIPGSIASRSELLKIAFRAPDATSPAELGISGDDRQLGLGLHDVLLSEPSRAR